MGEPWLDSLSEDWDSEPHFSSPASSLANSRHGTQSFRNSQSRIPHLAHNMRRNSSGGSYLKPRSARGIAKSKGLPVLSERSSSHMNLPDSTYQDGSMKRLPSSMVSRKTSSNFSDSQQSVQHHDVENIQKETPEWKKRLQTGEDIAGDGFDLFSPSKLEGMFSQPQQSTPEHSNQQSFIPSDSKPWSSLKSANPPIVDQYSSYRTTRSRVPPMASLPELNEEEEELEDPDHSISAISSDLVHDGSVRGIVKKHVHDLANVQRIPSIPDKRQFLNDGMARKASGDPRWRTLSGQQEIRNEVISPVTASTKNTISTKALRESIELNPEILKQKLMEACLGSDHRPSSRSSDRDISYNGHGSEEVSVLHEELQPDLTAHSLPEDLSMGTQDFSLHGPSTYGNKRTGTREFSSQMKKLDPLEELSELVEHNFSSAKFRSSPPPYSTSKDRLIDDNDQSHEISAEFEGGSVIRHETSPHRPGSVGSPLKLFGNRDTYTNNKLLRVLSQYEEDRSDSSNSMDAITQQHDALAQSSNGLRMSQFGKGELDAFNFAKEVERPRPASIPLEVEGNRIFRSLAELSIDDEGTITKENPGDDVSDGSMEDANTKRVPSSPAKDRTPKRRRTLLRDEIKVDGVGVEVNVNYVQDRPGIAGKKRKDAKPGEGGEEADPDVLAARAILKPRSESRKFSSQTQLRSASQDSTIKKKLPPNELTEALAAELAAFAEGASQAQHDSRKPSLATRDYMEEANKVMEFIRARGKPKSVLPEIQEPVNSSELDADRILDLEVEDDSTVEPFSRPPSREGPVKPREDRRVAVHDSQIANHLQKFKDSDDLDALASTSVVTTLPPSKPSVARMPTTFDTQESDPPNIRILNDHDCKRSAGSISSSIDRDQNASEQHSENSSRPTIVTDSTSSSGRKGLINSGTVSIPDHVGTMTFDHERKIWIKRNLMAMAKLKELELQTRIEKQQEATMDDDPFEDIPDLSIDEQHEAAMKVVPKPGSRPSSLGTVQNIRLTHQEAGKNMNEETELMNAGDRSSLGEEEHEHISGDDKTCRIKPSFRTSSLRSEASKHEERLHQGLPSREPASIVQAKLQPRVVTIAFSSPVASAIPPSVIEISAPASDDEDFLPPDDSDDDIDYLKSPKPVPVPVRAISKSHLQAGRQFINSRNQQPKALQFERHPVSSIEERDEGAVETEGMSLVCVKPGELATPISANHGTTRKPISAYRGTSLLCLTPLSEFTMHQADRANHPEESFVQERAHPKALLQAHGALALSVDTLVKAITDATPDEPFWENLRKLDLRNSRLQSVYGLQDYCAGLETLNISSNVIAQLDGLPSTLRQLDISKNKVNDFTSWTHLLNLQYLDVSGNELESLQGFSSLIHLRDLKCSGNKIQDIEGVLDLDGLISLNLQHNDLVDIDFEGVDMPRLEVLDLSNNKLEKVQNLHCLPQLRSLNLHGNCLKEFRPLEPLTSLKSLTLSVNELHALDLGMFPCLEELYLDQNSIKNLSGLSTAKHLRTLSIRDQRNSSDILNLVLETPNECSTMLLSSNVLPTGSLRLPRFPHYNLQRLEIAACGLRSLPVGFGDYFPNCRILNLNFNAISDLSPLIGSVKLNTLSLASNRVKRLRRTCLTLSRIPDLEALELRNNPLTVGFYAPLQGPHNEFDVLPKRPIEQDLRWLQLMDETTALKRKMMELLLVEGCEALRELDGSILDRELITGHDAVWDSLTTKGVLIRAIEAPPASGDGNIMEQRVEGIQLAIE